MAVYPYSRLFIGSKFSIAISGPHIQTLDSTQGHLLSHITESGPIRCAAIDPNWRYIATCADDKQLKIWATSPLKVLNQRELPKKPTNIAFTKDAQTIIVSDKFGDVFSYTLEYTPPTGKQKSDGLSSHENPSGGKLILGHVSVLTTFLLTQDEGYIITADRDEHIRVSWYPQGFVIEMYCLGHEKYVSAIHTPLSSPSLLVSGGGDPMFKIWNWVSGALQYEIPILDAVKPFIAVAPKPKRGVDEEDDEVPHKSKAKGKKRRKGKKGKEKAVEEEDRETPDIADDDADGHAQPRQVLVIHRIASTEHAGTTYLVFNAVGATALFACRLQPNAEIVSFDFRKPVLDFLICENGFIWTLLDGNWVPCQPQDNQGATSSMVRILHLTSEGKLAELTLGGPRAALLASLNSTSLVPADAEGLRKLEFYIDLTWLPKYGIEPEGRGKSERAVSEGPEEEVGEDQGKQMTKRELARLKNKRKVLAKAQEAATKTFDWGEQEEEDEDEEEPVSKKSRGEREESPMEMDDPEI